MWIIKKGSLYVSKPGSKNSYTDRLERAVTYQTEAEARRNACENEHVESVYNILR